MGWQASQLPETGEVALTDDELDTVTGAVDVHGATVRYRRVPNPGAPPLVLIHGARAHWGWWQATLPLLSDGSEIILPDLTGHGDSDHRDEGSYGMATWADEVAAVLELLDTPAWVVGHSMGGQVATYIAALYPQLVRGVVAVDTLFRFPEQHAWEQRPAGARRRVYPDREIAISRFRLTPAETKADPEVFQRVAEQSICEVDGGWTWKFDPAVRNDARFRLAESGVLTPGLPPLGCLYGEHSSFDKDENVAHLSERLDRPVPARVVPDAFHHVPLDAPQSCVELIRALFAELDG